jgi:S1-C subfamily serine protease
MKRVLKLMLGTSLAVLTFGGMLPASVRAVDPPHRIAVYSPGHPYPHRRALEVTQVAWGSPAARAGLERGDLILEVDGRDVDTPGEFHRALHRTGHRGTLTVKDVRTGRLIRLQVNPAGGHMGVNLAAVRY